MTDPHRTSSTDAIDPVTLALLINRFEAVTARMVNTVLRTGRSGVLNTGRDVSCCILTSTGDVLAMAESAPIHVTSGPDIQARSMVRLFPKLQRGDAFLHNSPYDGNSHAADHSILVPVLDDEGVHRFTVFTKAHQADCGCSVPTTYVVSARDVYEEGSLIFPCVKVQEDYRDRQDIIRMCEVRIRVPEQWRGDYLAAVGGARVGERELLELGHEVGWDVLETYAAGWLDYSERRMVSAIRRLPRKSIRASSRHDPFPGVPDGVPVHVTVEVRPAEAEIEIDLRDNPDCLPCSLNLTESTSRSSAIVGILNSIDPSVPANSGSARRLIIRLRENCCVGVPRHPASCGAATTNLADRVTNLVQRALADVGEGVGLAEAAALHAPGAAVVSGRDPRAVDAPFVNQIFLGTTGGPGSPVADGWLTFHTTGAAGMCYRDSVELDELRYPLRIVEQRLIPDTEGAGRYRGAPSGYVEYGPVDCPLEIMYAHDGTVNTAQGARGGLAGGPGAQHVRDEKGEIKPAEACARIVLAPGETMISVSGGGGGYGAPTERDPERVRRDVLGADRLARARPGRVRRRRGRVGRRRRGGDRCAPGIPGG